MLDEIVKAFMQRLVDNFNGYCDSDLYTMKNHLFDHIIEKLQTFGGLSLPDSSPYEYFILHINHFHVKTSQRSQSRMMGTVSVLQKS